MRRRLPVWRATTALIAAVLVAQIVSAAGQATSDAQAAWMSDREVWVAVAPIDAGVQISPDDVVRRPAPAALRPDDAVADDPTGERARVALAVGEIVRAADLGAANAGPVAALVSDGRHAVNITVSADIFALGDVVGLFAVLDGRVLVDNGVVVATQPGSITVSVDQISISRVVGELSRGGIEATLVGR